jgi:phosphoribosylamine---glycine ligase
MNVLLLGSGGREHAIAWKLAQSTLLKSLFIAPGNAGTSLCGTNVNLNPLDFDAVKKFVLQNNIEMVVVGPEAPLVAGIYDYFNTDLSLKNVAVIGPSKKGAALEGSKKIAKEFMIANHIPTAKYQSFDATTINEGLAFLETLSPPYVLKADGLAAGKGVLIISDINEAKDELKKMLLNKKFGAASETVVIEEHLKGIELSVFVLTDGENYLILPEAKDYKRIGEGDTGLNTGGMGAISPVSFVDDAFMKKVEEQIVKPTIAGFKKSNITYKGFVFIGLMNDAGNPKVIEYNVRMGDPETEVVIPRIQNDLLQLFQKLAEGKLNEEKLQITTQTAVTVMVVSGGYPEKHENNKAIVGLNEISESIVFHAGTKQEGDKILTNGGRVFAVTSLGENMKQALEKSYTSISKTCFENMYFRKDIGFDL